MGDRTDVTDPEVIIVGSGMSAISLAVHLGAAGVPYLILERNSDLGGTWHENTYPGARVDVGSRSYSYSFEPAYRWRHHFAPAAEVKEYLSHCADKYEVRDHILFDRLVTGMEWDDRSRQWHVTARHGDRTEVHSARILVSAVGLFSRPKPPDVDGIDTFTGPVLHTAAWDAGVDLAGRSVGLVGTGSSGVQIANPLSEVAGRLTIFQRSGTWVSEVPNYVTPVGDDEQWLLDHVPYYLNWLRLAQIYEIGDARKSILEIDPAWREPGTVSKRNADLRDQLLRYMRRQLGGDAELVRKCTPDYPPMAKRLPKDNGWFAALLKEHVSLVDDPVVQIAPDGVECASGSFHELDVLVFATGFAAADFLSELDVRGPSGSLREAWAEDGPRAYLGMTVPDFPNFFCLYGPNMNGTSGAPTAWREMQSRVVLAGADRSFCAGHDLGSIGEKEHTVPPGFEAETIG
ncbi:NAD(P)/FAD-dependent oxidoreductase [Saccharopolyspora sp. ASAGF58]|uniref:flavin-containing monooxygenase n=1 Tax=Saccharopolyspora sp. ASAGF58 TaxID=2719023 RepID=UPI0014400991|nr:NAD(P)/FAD-dependent oxidoreductase [Saccharopolyspora sp. ASAGF58]QIZ38024.1 hypothetical protein FDZ84_29950 [Saccharopolyspora sp. ASAGF58]